MAKLSILLLGAVFGVLLVAATAHKTTITTLEIEEEIDENQRRGREGCREQIQRAQQLSHCQDFLREQSGGGGGQFGPGREFDPSGRYGPGSEFGPGSRGTRGRETSEHFQPCCSQLRQVDDDRCRSVHACTLIIQHIYIYISTRLHIYVYISAICT